MKIINGKFRIIWIALAFFTAVLMISTGLFPQVSQVDQQSYAYAEDNDDNASADNVSQSTSSNNIEVTEDIIRGIAVNWAKFICPDADIEVSDIIELYDYDNSLCGFSVNLTDGEYPYGYINLDFNSENIISEFAIEKNAEGLASKILSEENVNDNFLKDLSKHAKLYKRLPFEYSLSLDNDNKDVVYDQTFGEMSQKKFQSERGNIHKVDKKNVVLLKKSENLILQNADDLSTQANKIGSWNDIVINFPNGLTNVDTLTTLASKVSRTEAWSETSVKKYACAVQAMMNIALQKSYIYNNTEVNTYNYLWTLSSTTTDHVSGDVTYGSTSDSKIQTALVALAKYKGHVNSSCATSSSPTYTTFKNAVNSGKSSTLSMHIVKTDGTNSGHTVSVVGYRAAKNNAGTVYSYVYVADGWSSFKYVCISNTDNFSSLYSTVLTIAD
jgi:hypothetical protein